MGKYTRCPYCNRRYYYKSDIKNIICKCGAIGDCTHYEPLIRWEINDSKNTNWIKSCPICNDTGIEVESSSVVSFGSDFTPKKSYCDCEIGKRQRQNT